MRTLRISPPLTILPDMLAAVILRAPVVQMHYSWRVVAVLPMGGELVIGSFGDGVEAFGQDNDSFREALALYEKVLSELEDLEPTEV